MEAAAQVELEADAWDKLTGSEGEACYYQRHPVCRMEWNDRSDDGAVDIAVRDSAVPVTVVSFDLDDTLWPTLPVILAANDALQALEIDVRTAIVTLTHDPKLESVQLHEERLVHAPKHLTKEQPELCSRAVDPLGGVVVAIVALQFSKVDANEFPYHYLAHMDENTPQIKRTLGWGFEYLSYINVL